MFTMSTLTAYRYGFNGKEKDDEVNVSGGDYDFGARIYDARLGRFTSKDPVHSGWTFETPYSFAGNTPIGASDKDGEKIFYVNKDGSVLDLSIAGNLSKVDNADFRDAYSTLLETFSGSSLLDEFNSGAFKNHDIYIGKPQRHTYHETAIASTGYDWGVGAKTGNLNTDKTFSEGKHSFTSNLITINLTF